MEIGSRRLGLGRKEGLGEAGPWDHPVRKHISDMEGLVLALAQACYFPVGKNPQYSMRTGQEKVKVEAGQGGSGLAEGQKANEMQNNIQANAHSFCMRGFWEIRGASQSKGCLLLSPSQSPLGSRIDMLYRTAQ